MNGAAKRAAAAAPDARGRRVDADVMREVHRDAARRRDAKRRNTRRDRGGLDDDDDGDGDGLLDGDGRLAAPDEDPRGDAEEGGRDVDARDARKDLETRSDGDGDRDDDDQRYRDRAAERRAGRGGLVDAVDAASEYANVLGSNHGEELGHLRRGLDLDLVRQRREEIRIENEKRAAEEGTGTEQVSIGARAIVRACLARNRTAPAGHARAGDSFQPGAMTFVYEAHESIPRLKAKSRPPLQMLPLKGIKASALAWQVWAGKKAAQTIAPDIKNEDKLAGKGDGDGKNEDDDDIFSDIEEEYQVNMDAVLAKREEASKKSAFAKDVGPTLPPKVDGATAYPEAYPEVGPQKPTDTHAGAAYPEVGPEDSNGAYGPQMPTDTHAGAGYPEVGPADDSAAYGPQMPTDAHAGAACPEVGPEDDSAAYGPQMPRDAAAAAAAAAQAYPEAE